MGQSFLGFGFRRSRRAGLQEKYGALGVQREHMELSDADVLRLHMARECYTKYPTMIQPPKVKHGREITENDWFSASLLDRAENWPISSSYYSKATTQGVLFSLFIAGLAYGGLHLLAWSPPLRTSAETLIWRMSGVAIIVYGAIPELAWCSAKSPNLCVKLNRKRAPNWLIGWVGAAKSAWHKSKRLLRDVFSCILLILESGFAAIVFNVVVRVAAGNLIAVATILYAVSRVYLVVECFISVDRLPESVFETPYWARCLPNLS